MNGIFPVNAYNPIHIMESVEVSKLHRFDKKHTVRFYSLEKFPLAVAVHGYDLSFLTDIILSSTGSSYHPFWSKAFTQRLRELLQTDIT